MCQSILLCSCAGKTVLIENIEETLEPTLDNLLGRNLIKKGKLVNFVHSIVPLAPSLLSNHSVHMYRYKCFFFSFFSLSENLTPL